MTTLLASSTATGASANEADNQAFLDNLRTYLADCLGTDSANKAAIRALLATLGTAGGTMTGALTMNNAVNEARATVVGHATTSPIWAAAANSINLTGAPIYTTFPAAPQAGAKRRLYPEVGAIFTHGGAFDIVGNASFTAAAGDIVDVEAITTTAFRLIPIKENGQPVASTSQTSEPYIFIRNEQASGTAAGTFTNGAWRTVPLNTEVADTGNNASIASNQITLLAGTYRFDAICPAFTVNHHQARLQNITDATTVTMGTSEFAPVASNGASSSRVSGRFTIAATKTFELQHQCQTTSASTDGFGTPATFGGEVYATIKLWKEF